MGQEIDLLINYPKAKRNLEERVNNKTEEDREIARKFGKEFFDGDRKHGYGGLNYNPIYWGNVTKTFKDHWELNSESTILDVGCAKGFMMNDFNQLIPGIKIRGIDISEYAIKNTIDTMKHNTQVGDAKNIPYEDNSFDYVISINTIHNLEEEDCAQSLREIERVSKKGAFITVDAYNNKEEKNRMFKWNLTAKTILSVQEWKELFKINKFSGDYYWFIP
jgi:ubiquinone/menaquinone biosynthesis C-methylase UbiE|tara:strand:- start:538 stop:1197 length:660 start_codon:yes stop_codon:yes gene_type:complete